MTSSLVKSKQTIGAHFSTLFSAIFLSLMFLNIQIDWIILKTYDQQFTLTTKKSLHIIFKQQYLLYMSPQYGELRPTSGWDRLVSLGHPR